MNDRGLCVLCLFIDEADSPDRPPGGVPIDVAIREALVARDIDEAARLLERLPRAAPTTYMLLHDGRAACVEASPRRVATLWLRGPGELCHANHAICDQRMQAEATWRAEVTAVTSRCGPDSETEGSDVDAAPTGNEVGHGGGGGACEGGEGADAVEGATVAAEWPHSSEARLRSLHRAIRNARASAAADGGVIDVDVARQLLCDCPPAHPELAPSIARVVMEPGRARMHVRFFGEERWHVVGFGGDEFE